MALTRWQAPTFRHDLRGHAGEVTWLELFFDLVYVAALIQLGDQLSSDVSWSGLGRFAGVFAVLWWTWTGTTAFTNRFAVDDITHRVLVFVQMVAVGNIALLAVGPNDNRWEWFALAYVVARVPLLVMYVRVLPQGGAIAQLARLYIVAFGAGAAVWAASILVPEPARFVVWAVAIAIEFGTPIFAARKINPPPTHVDHFRERYAIFTIIVFGESFVKTLTKLAERGVSVETQVFGGLVFVMAAALWWTYFDDVADSDVRPGNKLMMVGWVYAHLPLTAALTAFGVASKKVVDIEAFDSTIYQPYLWLLAGSIAMALVATAALDALTVSPHFAVAGWDRIGPRLLAAAAVFGIAAIWSSPAVAVLCAIASAVVGQIAYEVWSATRADKRVDVLMAESLGAASAACAHLEAASAVEAPASAGCSECTAQGKQWVQLRVCLSCGAVGCCDDSPGRHARAHYEESGHLVIASIEHGDEWAYCFAHDAIDETWQRRSTVE